MSRSLLYFVKGKEIQLMLKNFIELTRLNRPIGIFLLFWPCCWGLGLAKAPFYLYGVFLIGAVLMRSAGCIVNDFFDRKLDAKVQRTKNRPLASGNVGITEAALYLFGLLLGSLFLLLFFLPPICWGIGVVATIMLIVYPLMKRITFFPQLFLGFTFNIGVLMGWFSSQTEISFSVVILYLAGVLWTLGYDTIYGFQDIEDDIRIGVKSASIYVKDYPRVFLSFTYGLFFLLILYVIPKYSVLLLAALLLKQLFVRFDSPEDALKNFKLNFWIGFWITFCIQ
jgi:4-hydroxybenzoate polyprenyl transferase